ncbi:DNA-directed RNA polymerase specialized sigma54-like protein [Chryseobacterium ginsenosidimutans]|uniref:type VI secretion system transmembrane protein TssO n=1 Tax=Chryseobacterium ginsenosidimutans TaxID=687846 RepID=UPI002784BC04|nr:type VI secretion system transmembrane protein TssO [Chryseobacterium ginsenosidimutans]MDQ0595315.1 DNA-directed RNA polymerase specialized sigma54-like protein [Chryseobacterium ginsenosidimutans]
MQGQITLSKKERHYQFLYLILMLVVAIIFLGIIFLKGFESPFSDEDIISVQNLEEKAKFDQKQKYSFKTLDSTFSMINRLTDEPPQPFVENNIIYGINDVVNYFQNGDNITDIRKDAYPQIAKFYKMYFNDKKIISSKTENIKSFKKQFDECSIGFKEKRSQLFQRETALKSRTQ